MQNNYFYSPHALNTHNGVRGIAERERDEERGRGWKKDKRKGERDGRRKKEIKRGRWKNVEQQNVLSMYIFSWLIHSPIIIRAVTRKPEQKGSKILTNEMRKKDWLLQSWLSKLFSNQFVIKISINKELEWTSLYHVIQ